jgi:hypothetical protein
VILVPDPTSNARHADEAARAAFREDGALVDREHPLMQDERGAERGAPVPSSDISILGI